MTLSIPTSLPPMEALLVPDLPRGPEWQYEPKWDGFRCLAFKNGTTIDLFLGCTIYLLVKAWKSSRN